ncbi:UNVERIFIED_CONTAM: hypothetical protein PYX00_001160 [Menopon gallinae]|uniref:G-protein coupled receptors family 1 profile domain-containing protein n=1 Tax=Menopon gallinae TaxID=328185 RepID=A0AAW2IBV0_9NEOP
MSPDVNSTEEYQEWTAEDLTFLILYCCSSVVGTTANIFVIMGIFSQNTRSRNILILSLCASDLMVCTISMPLSASTVFIHIWTMGVLFCKTAYFFQSLPVAASTASLMMLALDRYATVKHSRILSKFRPRKMIITVWTGAAFITSPILYAREVSLQACREFWPSDQIRTAFTLSHIAIVYLIPCLTVASCHFSVGHELCASSQPSLPLPIPLIRKPQHVIVVVPCGGNQEDSSSDDSVQNDGRNQKPQLMAGRQSKIKTEQNTRTESRRKPPLVKQMSRQSTHSRRRLANMLVAMVIVFAICWAPYVVLRICSEAGLTVSASILPFCLLLGHTHSAINPLVYYLSNRQSLSISHGCGFHWPCDKNSVSGFRRPPPSSTNEAALGVFHPCYTTKRFQPRGGCTNDYL